MAQDRPKPKRTLTVIGRFFLLLTALTAVFCISFFVTLSIKTDNPMQVIHDSFFATTEEKRRKMFSDLEEERRRRRNTAELERQKEESGQSKEETDRIEESNETRSSETRSDETQPSDTQSGERANETQSGGDQKNKFAGSSLSDKIDRLTSIKTAVNERIKEKEHYVRLEDIPRSLRQAIVAVEDSRFYSHRGFDPEGIARATVVNVEAGQIEEGASTITQQLVKNLFLTQEQSFTRKVEEILLAINLERNFSKDEILELYLNTIYFGSNFYGVYEAAEGYFGKEPSELTLAESAMLAGLPNAPSLYSPYVDFMLAKKRQLVVINAMVRANILTDREAERARVETINLVDD